MKTKETKGPQKQFQKGDLVRLNIPGSSWDGIIGIYKGVAIEDSRGD
jgi:hypothetical protein